MEEDPTAFDYDDVYDNMKAPPKPETKKLGEPTGEIGGNGQSGLQIVKETQKHQIREKPKYIMNLLVKAEEKKREQELVMERKMQKEREEDENMHEDKQKYVTAAYKKQLQEANKWKEIEAERARADAKQDVRKQGDISGFYRNLLNNNVSYGGETAQATTVNSISDDAKARVLEKLTKDGRNIDLSTIEKVIETKKEKKEPAAQSTATPSEADWSKKLREKVKKQKKPLGEGEERNEEDEETGDELEEQEEAEDPSGKRALEDGDEVSEAKRLRPEIVAAERMKALSKEPEEIVVDSTPRNDETAVMSAKERYLARKKQKEDEAAAARKR